MEPKDRNNSSHVEFQRQTARRQPARASSLPRCSSAHIGPLRDLHWIGEPDLALMEPEGLSPCGGPLRATASDPIGIGKTCVACSHHFQR